MMLHVDVSTARGTIHFVAMTDQSERPEDLKIEPEFYEKGVPEGTHYEIGILAPPVWQHPHAQKIHWHLSKRTQTYFVCWIYQLRTQDDALQFLNAWAVGTAYTMETGKDFAEIFYGCDGDIVRFLAHMKTAHDIFVS